MNVPKQSIRNLIVHIKRQMKDRPHMDEDWRLLSRNASGRNVWYADQELSNSLNSSNPSD